MEEAPLVGKGNGRLRERNDFTAEVTEDAENDENGGLEVNGSTACGIRGVRIDPGYTFRASVETKKSVPPRTPRSLQ
jgi:hypothetical protein